MGDWQPGELEGLIGETSVDEELLTGMSDEWMRFLSPSDGWMNAFGACFGLGAILMVMWGLVGGSVAPGLFWAGLFLILVGVLMPIGLYLIRRADVQRLRREIPPGTQVRTGVTDEAIAIQIGAGPVMRAPWSSARRVWLGDTNLALRLTGRYLALPRAALHPDAVTLAEAEASRFVKRR